jgi:hypothetical protein
MDDTDAVDLAPPTGRSVPRRATDVAAIDVDGEAVVFHEGTDRVHLLNPTATLLWSVLDGVATIDELSAELADAFGAPLEVVREDVLAGVTDLLRDGLVHDSSDPNASSASAPVLPSTSELGAPAGTPAGSHVGDRVLAEPPDT